MSFESDVVLAQTKATGVYQGYHKLSGADTVAAWKAGGRDAVFDAFVKAYQGHPAAPYVRPFVGGVALAAARHGVLAGGHTPGAA